MKQISTLCVAAVLTLFCKPIYGGHIANPFTKPSVDPAKFIRFEGSVQDNKIVLNWKVKDNETADQFEVERSVDGENFEMAALVFGTDSKNADNYQFYERPGNKKVMYRIKLIGKDRATDYSKVIELTSTTTH